jgi:DNA-binding MarR family transcriptional regulator
VSPYKDIAERRLTIAELRVWLWISAVQNGRKRIFVEQIVDALGLHRSAVALALRRLREQGLIEGEGDRHTFGKVLKVVNDPARWKPDEKREWATGPTPTPGHEPAA